MFVARELVFRDSEGHQKKHTLEQGGHLKFMTAVNKFLQKYVSENNTTFQVEETLTGETLIIETAVGILARQHAGEQSPSSFRRFADRLDMAELALRFGSTGHSALDRFGPWSDDRDSLLPDGPYENVEIAWWAKKAAHEARKREIRQMPKLNRAQLTKFCKAWGDHGYVEHVSDAEQYYVLFDSRTREAAGAARDEVLATIAALGLEVVDTPNDAADGEIWVRSDPRVDLELEKWS